jgi:hypothetical protein
MDCAAVQPLLSPFLDGELDGSDREAVTVHLDCCPVCRQKLGELRSLCEIWSSTEPCEPGERDWQRIAKSLDRLNDKGATRGFRRRTWVAAAILIALCASAGAAIARFGVEGICTSFNRRDPVNLIDYLDGENSRQGKAVDADNLCDEVELTPLRTHQLPDGYKLKNCCVFCDGIVRYKFARGEAEVIVLLYPCGLNVVHGNKPLLNFKMKNGGDLRIAQCKKRVSASWQVKGTAVSLIASSDLLELTDLLRYIDNQLAEAK